MDWVKELEDFVLLVAETRAVQVRFFKSRAREDLSQLKKLEAEVDAKLPRLTRTIKYGPI